MKLPLLCLGALVCAGLSLHAGITTPALPLKNPVTTELKLGSVGPLSFGEHGLLLIAEPGASSIIAVDSGDVGPLVKMTQTIPDVGALAAEALQTTPEQIQIVDMKPNPASG